MRMGLHRGLEWPLPGFNTVSGNCFYMLTEDAAIVKDGRVFLFEFNGKSASMSFIFERLHGVLGCEEGARHPCAGIIKHWIEAGILVQTYSPN